MAELRDARRIDPATLAPEADALRPLFEHYYRHGLHGAAPTLRSVLDRVAQPARPF